MIYKYIKKGFFSRRRFPTFLDFTTKYVLGEIAKSGDGGWKTTDMKFQILKEKMAQLGRPLNFYMMQEK